MAGAATGVCGQEPAWPQHWTIHYAIEFSCYSCHVCCQVTDEHVATLTVLTRLTSLRLVHGREDLDRDYTIRMSTNCECSSAALCHLLGHLQDVIDEPGFCLAVVLQTFLQEMWWCQSNKVACQPTSRSSQGSASVVRLPAVPHAG